MTTTQTGIRSLSISLPSQVRTNDYWREKYPGLVAAAEEKSLARTFAPIDPSSNTLIFDEEMEPYLADPFRGTVERRILGSSETGFMLESRAAREALEAALREPAKVVDRESNARQRFLVGRFGEQAQVGRRLAVGAAGRAQELEGLGEEERVAPGLIRQGRGQERRLGLEGVVDVVDIGEAQARPRERPDLEMAAVDPVVARGRARRATRAADPGARGEGLAGSARDLRGGDRRRLGRPGHSGIGSQALRGEDSPGEYPPLGSYRRLEGSFAGEANLQRCLHQPSISRQLE